MHSAAPEDELLSRLADEFLDRLRQREKPTIDEYVGRHPELAEQIRELLPALVTMESLGRLENQTSTASVEASGAFPSGPPAFIGEFRIIGEIGVGGMGVVYKARQESLGRSVALKILPPNLTRKEAFLQRFQREAKAAARLHHTNIVQVYGMGEWQGIHYIAMQFIHGQSIDRVLDDLRLIRERAQFTPSDQSKLDLGNNLARSLITGFRRDEHSTLLGGEAPPHDHLPPLIPKELPADRVRYFREVAILGSQAAEGLAHAHGLGVLHRDIKPANLLLDSQGTIWIADFGLAKSDDSDDLTAYGDVVGTLRYIPPERFHGQTDERGDVYSLGVTLYEMLSLTPAIEDANQPRMVKLICEGSYVPLRIRDPFIPRDLETIVQKAMARDPDDRYATAQALAEDLCNFLADRPIRARRHSTIEKLWRLARRNPLPATLVTALFLVIITAFIAGSSLLASRTSALTQARAAERERTLKLFEARVTEDRASRFSRRMGQRFQTLDSIREAVTLAKELELPAERYDELRNLAIAAMALPDIRLAKEWTNLKLQNAIALDSKFLYHARVTDDGDVTIRSVADESVLFQFPACKPRSDVGVDFNIDAKYLLMHSWSDGRWLRVWRLTGPNPPKIIEIDKNVADAVFSPDGRSIAVLTGDSTLSQYDLDSERLIRMMKVDVTPILTVGRPEAFMAFHPANPNRLALGGSDTVRIIDLESGNTIGKPLVHPGGVGEMAWHPKCELLAVATEPASIQLWNPQTGERMHNLVGFKNSGIMMRFNRTGNLLLSWGWDDTVRFWNPRTGNRLFQFPGAVYPPGLGVEDRVLAALAKVQPRDVHGLWEIAHGGELRTLTLEPVGGPSPSPFELCAHSNGRWIVATFQDGPRLFDLALGKQLLWLPLGRTTSVQSDPSGSLLISTQHALWRWPISTLPVDESKVVIDQPELLLSRQAGGLIGISKDGQLVSSPLLHAAAIVDIDQPDRPKVFGPHRNITEAKISLDGKWLATSGHHAYGIKIWNVATREQVKELLSEQKYCRVWFSPDERWLMTASDELRLWQVGTWELYLEIPRASKPAFTHDGKLLAAEISRGIIGLFNPDTRRELARLENPKLDGANALAFTPDGQQLAVSSETETGWAMHVRNLRKIREQLAELGLDWEAR